MKFDGAKLILISLIRLLVGVLNFVLFLNLLVLGLILAGILTGASFEMPGRICDKIEVLLRQNGLRFSADSIIFDMDGEVVFKGVKLGFEGAKHDVLDLRSARLKFRILPALAGDFKFQSIDLRGGRVYPFVEGEKSGVLGDCLDLTISRRGGVYRLENSNVNIGKFGLILSGQVPRGAVDELLYRRGGSEPYGAQKGSVNLELLKAWADVSSVVLDFQEELKDIKNPILLADFSMEKNGRVRIRASAFAENLKQKFSGVEAEVCDLRIFALYDSEDSADSFRLSAVSNSVKSDFGLVAEHASVSCVCNFKEEKLSDVKALLIGAEFKGVSAKYLGAYKDMLTAQNYAQDWILNAKIGRGFILANTEGSLEKFSVQFESELDCAELLKCSLIPKLKELEMFSFGAPLIVFGSGEFELSEKLFFDLKADIFARDSLFFGVDVKSVCGSLSYNSESGAFWAKNVEVESVEGWNIGGDVYQNLKNFDYRFLLTGRVRPMAIAHFMEKWWTEVFSDFSFKEGKFPYADISVAGRWGEPEYIYVFGSANADGGMRNGVEFEKARLDVWVNPSHISILNLYVANGDRVLTGALDWTYPEHKLTRYAVNKVFANSTLNKRELIAMGGDRVKDVVKILDFTEPPTIKLKLFMPNPALGGDVKDSANLQYFSPGLTRASKFDLQNLKFSAYALGDDIEINRAEFDFGGGSGKGDIKLSKVDSRDWFSASVSLNGANQYTFVETLQSLGDSSDGQGSEPIEESYRKGSIFGGAEIEGFMDDAKSLKGSGNIRLENEDLAAIHLFGAISRVADAMHIPLGSFDMRSALSSFELSDGSVSLPNLKIFGDTAIVTGNAKYDFLSGDILAKAIFAPFAAVKLPILSQIVSLADPLLSVVQIDISGKFENPDISLSIKPLNLFKKEANILIDMGRRIEKESKSKK